MAAPNPPSRFSAYSSALKSISTRTKTPLPSLVLSFGILHEVTAIAPLFIFFYTSRALGLGDKMIQSISEDPSLQSEDANGPQDITRRGRRKLSGWVEEGDRWAARVGTRYGFFGYEKRQPGDKADVEELTHRPGHLAGDVANAVVAYAVTKALLPVRIGLSLYLAPAFSRTAVEPIRKFAIHVHHRIPLKPEFAITAFKTANECSSAPHFEQRWNLGGPEPSLAQGPARGCWSLFVSGLVSSVRCQAKPSHHELSFRPSPGLKSTMPKLKFKRSGEEEAEHRARKARRAEKKRKRGASSPSSSRRVYGDTDEDVTRRWASSDEDQIPEHASRSSKTERTSTRARAHSVKLDEDAVRAQMEEEDFRERLFGAMGDDERLDGLESHFNDFAHVPDRWKQAATGSVDKVLYDEDDFLRMDPSTLGDDEYAEWVRIGMYRKSHAAEHAERVRRKAAAAERKAAEKARRAESKRLEKLAEEERRKRKKEREKVKQAQAKENYHVLWKTLLEQANASDASGLQPLQFHDIPWPIYHQPSGSAEEEFTRESLTSFLLSNEDRDDKKARKDILRETFLRFHPDKFEGRFMRRVREEDQERVREAISQISRVLNHL